MRRYSECGEREMDLAYASLYWLATDTGLTEILTVGVSDFSRYRLPRGKAFRSSRCCSMRHTVGRFRDAFDLPDLPGEGDDVCGGADELERGR